MSGNVVSVELKVIDNLTKNAEAISQQFGNQMKNMAAMRKDMLDQTGQMAIKAAEKEAENLARIQARAETEYRRANAQAAAAEAGLVKDKFDRRIAIESAKHEQALSNLIGNDAAQEAELRRHNAVVAGIEMEASHHASMSVPGKFQMGFMQAFDPHMIGMVAGMGVAFRAASAAAEGFHQAITDAMDMQTIHQTIDFAAESAKQGAEDFRFLQLQAQTLGISMRDSAPQFALMEAAAKGTALEGKGVRDVFKSMSEAAVTLHMNTDQTSRGFYALQEMMSMGSVQTRQLRMLSLSLPGAFQDAAKAMGVTTEEMMKMMAHGKVMTDDFLPKFAEVMREKYEKPSVQASDNARQSIQKFNNMIFESSAAVGETFLNAMGMGAKAILKVADAYDAASIAAQRARKEAFEAKFFAGAFQNYGEAAVKATGQVAAFLKQLQDDFDKAHPKKPEAHQDTADQIANQVKLEEELQVALAAAREDGEGKKVAEENRRFTKEKEHLLGSKKEIELAEQIHRTNLAAIRTEYARKAQEEAEKEAGERFQQIRDNEKKQQDILVNSNLAAREKLEQLKKENGVAEVGDKTNSGRKQQLEQDRKDELAIAKEKFGDTEYANEIIFEINRKYDDKDKALKADQKKREAELFTAKTGYYEQYAQSVSQMIGVIGGKSKIAFLLQQSIAEAEIAMRTAVAVTTDGLNPLTAWKVPYDIALGAAQGAVVAGLAIKGFAGGTNYAPPGLAWVGERGPELVNFRGGERVHTARESAQMAGGGLSMGDMHFYFGSDVSPATAQMVGREVNRVVRGLMKNVETAKRRNIRGGVG